MIDYYIEALQSVPQSCVDAVVNKIVDALECCDEIVVIGNGGSLSIAEHFTSDLVKGIGGIKHHFGMIRCLGSNSAVLTAIANDLGYENIFLEQIRGMGFGSGLIISFSVSGTSPNILNVLKHYNSPGYKRRSHPDFLSFVGDKCQREAMKNETMIKVGFNEQDDCDSTDYYGVVEGVFGCLAHEIACRVNEKLQPAGGGK